MEKYKVSYTANNMFAHYSGKIEVWADNEEDAERIAIRKLKQHGDGLLIKVKIN